MLVYAKGELHQHLSKQPFVTCVTEDTPYDELRNLHDKKDLLYPVYLADDKYGMRGVDYRSQCGITLVIAAPFGDHRERLQGLFRVGRMGDRCYRIQDIDLDDETVIDKIENSKRKGKMHEAVTKVLTELEKYKPIVVSTIQESANAVAQSDPDADIYDFPSGQQEQTIGLH